MPRSPAFTLIELLVVVTIIVVLLALLTPALDRAINRAEDVKCMSNLHAVGRALTYYLQDHKRTFPRVSHFSQLFGDKPRNPDGSEAGGFQGSSGGGRDVDHRPLNKYLGYQGAGSRVPVAECPRDKGDMWENSANHCYTQYGTSYIEMTWQTWFRIKPAFGMAGNNSPSARQDSFKRTNNKVLVTDWPVYGDRHWDDLRSQWHADNKDGKMMMTVFADFHAELFRYDNEYNDDRAAGPDGYNNWDAPANAGFLWW